MKRIKPSDNSHSYPNKAVESIECRKRDFIIRIADWTRTKDAPTYDVEVYVGGVYAGEHSKSFERKADAIAFANAKTLELL